MRIADRATGPLGTTATILIGMLLGVILMGARPTGRVAHAGLRPAPALESPESSATRSPR
jgi:hypothetical protein